MEIYRQKKPPVIRWIVAAFFAVVFLADLTLVVLGTTDFIDQPIETFIHGFRTGWLTVVAEGVTFCSNTSTLIVICAVLLILPTRSRFGLPLMIAVGIAAGFHYAFKEIIERARPDELYRLIEVDGYSFPSGHANGGFVFYIFLLILVRRYLILNKHKPAAWLFTILIPILVAAIGLSRVYLGVHYPTDVIGGWALGIVLIIVLVTLYDDIYPSKYRITYDPPAWDTLRKRKEWKHPDVSAKGAQVLEFPKYRSPWRHTNAPSKQKPEEQKDESGEEPEDL
ncbi:MAG: phosphatase PAP2 family protein [Clostridiales Family XIII bacterium]|jgi:undecaprenyl-diphosphatase|nr:phosphatase PAP2 family protein [Clostridiales Family XIII bacterium]